MARPRTFVIGDIHGDLPALERVLARLPALHASDTVVFLGDYVDRGDDSRGVLERVQRVVREGPARTVTLKGNHEALWVESWTQPNLGFLLPRGNGAYDTWRSFAGVPPRPADEGPSPEELAAMMDVSRWFPREVLDWMAALPLWYEDEHALYVHAGLEGEGTAWKHPRECAEAPLLWMREPDFFRGYAGKRLVFGHTRVTDLPTEHLGRIAKFFDDPAGVWKRGDLIGIDTGCGKGGFLTALELPALRVYESR